ncbi:unnamed protein product, partial [Amoebophrya sp. A120]|eukprot:GSA120T00025025001.1
MLTSCAHVKWRDETFLEAAANALKFLIEQKRFDLPSLACCWNAFRLLEYGDSVTVFFPASLKHIRKQVKSHPLKSRDLAYLLRYCAHFKTHLVELEELPRLVAGSSTKTSRRLNSAVRATTSKKKNGRTSPIKFRRRMLRKRSTMFFIGSSTKKYDTRTRSRMSTIRTPFYQTLLDTCLNKMGSMRVAELHHVAMATIELQQVDGRIWDALGIHFLRNAENLDWRSFFQFSMTVARFFDERNAVKSHITGRARPSSQKDGVVFGSSATFGSSSAKLKRSATRSKSRSSTTASRKTKLVPNAFPLGGESYFKVLEAKINE